MDAAGGEALVSLLAAEAEVVSSEVCLVYLGRSPAAGHEPGVPRGLALALGGPRGLRLRHSGAQPARRAGRRWRCAAVLEAIAAALACITAAQRARLGRAAVGWGARASMHANCVLRHA